MKNKQRVGKPVIWPHLLRKVPQMRKCDVILDIGAGVRPMSLYRPKRHICVEPCATYCEVLRGAGYEVWQETAEEALSRKPKDIGAIYLLDVIEHMEKDEGLRVLQLAQAVAQEQIVVYTPLGFMKQTHDKWGLGEHEWQTHRSGWVPKEFPGWYIRQRPPGTTKGFIAIWNNTEFTHS
jgi:hypothetical protein